MPYNAMAGNASSAPLFAVAGGKIWAVEACHNGCDDLQVWQVVFLGATSKLCIPAPRRWEGLQVRRRALSDKQSDISCSKERERYKSQGTAYMPRHCKSMRHPAYPGPWPVVQQPVLPLLAFSSPFLAKESFGVVMGTDALCNHEWQCGPPPEPSAKRSMPLVHSSKVSFALCNARVWKRQHKVELTSRGSMLSKLKVKSRFRNDVTPLVVHTWSLSGGSRTAQSGRAHILDGCLGWMP
eukprot:925245-Pelagomonas_calceolata.AAC.23